jgi:hypothetical protein
MGFFLVSLSPAIRFSQNRLQLLLLPLIDRPKPVIIHFCKIWNFSHSLIGNCCCCCCLIEIMWCCLVRFFCSIGRTSTKHQKVVLFVLMKPLAGRKIAEATETRRKIVDGYFTFFRAHF